MAAQDHLNEDLFGPKYKGKTLYHGARFEAKVGDIIEPRKAIHGTAAFATAQLETAKTFSHNNFGPSSVVEVVPLNHDDVVELDPSNGVYEVEYASQSGFRVVNVLSSKPGGED
jgi:hypothetical protein